MKNIKLKSITLVLFLVSFGLVNAQTVQLDKPSGKLILLGINEVVVEGYSGSKIEVSLKGGHLEKDERASGLKQINGLGNTDNTGVGLSQSKDGTNLVLAAVSKSQHAQYIVKVPESINVEVKHSTHHGDDITFKNLKGEVEASVVFNDIALENVTGPIMVNCVHGDIDASFSSFNQSNPTSIVSVHGDVDVSLPASTKSNLVLSSGWGNIYTDFNIAVETKDGMKKISQSKVNGTINGGGNELQVKSSHGNVYLRKTK